MKTSMRLESRRASATACWKFRCPKLRPLSPNVSRSRPVDHIDVESVGRGRIRIAPVFAFVYRPWLEVELEVEYLAHCEQENRGATHRFRMLRRDAACDG